MARVRAIKPSFFKHESLGECEPLARLLFVGLQCHADREGRLTYHPKRLKAEILPYDDCELDGLIQQLDEHGLILVYEIDRQRLIQIVDFRKLQCPNIRENPSIIPASTIGDAVAPALKGAPAKLAPNPRINPERKFATPASGLIGGDDAQNYAEAVKLAARGEPWLHPKLGYISDRLPKADDFMEAQS